MRPRGRPWPQNTDDRAAWLETAGKYARHLTETGSRCHLSDGRPRFCSWAAAEWQVPGIGEPMSEQVGVRCTIHPGRRYLDSQARLETWRFRLKR